MSDKAPAARAGVIGYPITQSLSPVIHTEWARREGINANYELIEVTPEAFADQIKKLAGAGYKGVNVTMPHKGSALDIADESTQAASMAGAANMLTFDGSKIYADNSDIVGFQKALDEKRHSDEQLDTALVLGAGGAASGVIIALIRSGINKIIITNRTRAKAIDLIEKFQKYYGDINFEICDWDTRNDQFADIVVNTTSLGMSGMPGLDFAVNPTQGHKIIADIVYSPLVTALLKQAQDKNIRFVDGLSMLMHQAVPGYQAWLGNEAIVDQSLRNLLVEKIKQKESPFRPLLIGLTGSIGMGKSTVAKMFEEEGCAVWDADAAVHRLYDSDGAAVGPVDDAFPGVKQDGKINRVALSSILQKEPDQIKVLEAIVHPLVAKDREAFLRDATTHKIAVCLLDIPLLFENASEAAFDCVVVVSAAPDVQRERVLKRPGMTKEKFETILSRQMPDIEKRKRADYIVATDVDIEKTRAEVARVLSEIKSKN